MRAIFSYITVGDALYIKGNCEFRLVLVFRGIINVKMSEVLFALNIASAIVLILVLVFNGLNGVPNNGIFNNTIGNVSDKYPTDITPVGFTFSIWGIIYLFQLAWVAYALSCLWRTNSSGPIYENPVILDVVFHISYMIANVGNIGFLFAFDREKILPAALCVLLTTIFGFVALSKSFLTIEEKQDEMEKKEIITSYVLIVNGLDVYFTWTYIASCISIAMVLQYSKTVGLYLDPQLAGTIGLGIFLTGSVVFYVLDVTSFFETCKWMYMGYITILWALSGVLVKHYDITDRNTIITIVAIVITVAFLITKILMTIFNMKPLHMTGRNDTYEKVVSEKPGIELY